MKFMTFEELIRGCSAENKKIYELIQEQEAQEADVSVEEIRELVIGVVMTAKNYKDDMRAKEHCLVSCLKKLLRIHFQQ